MVVFSSLSSGVGLDPLSLLVLRLGLRLGALAGVGLVGVGSRVDIDWLRACTTALAASDAHACSVAGMSWKLSYALREVQDSFQRFRYCARCCICRKVRCCGTSMNMLPLDFNSNCAFTATFSSLSPFIRRMCPSHIYLRFRTSRTKS